MQKTILCYGDSNTWGYVPISADVKKIERYSRNIRWPGFLQKTLGENYYVVEEGLNSRTTNIDYQIPPNRNGKTYLAPCLYSHAPIDLVILALGGNDLKIYFNRTANDVCEGISELIDVIQQSQYGAEFKGPPEILLITHPIPLPICEQFVDEKGIHFLEGSIKKSKLLIPLYEELAKAKKCHFLNVSEKISPSPIDGVHLDQLAHKKLATLIERKIYTIFGAAPLMPGEHAIN